MANHLDRIGQQIGNYRLLRWLGEGGFGEVYLAEHLLDRAQVAIKLLRIQLNHREELKAFINEARTIRLPHPHIIPLLDFGLSREEIPFLVMEYSAQGTLRDRHPKGSQVPLPLIVDYAQQIGSALQYAHELHLIHHDVKPQNMLLRANGTVLLSDFGLATIAYESASLSQHSDIGGTIGYIAPEQIQGQIHVASDQYSLAVVVYEWITGRRPFEGTTAEVSLQHIKQPPPSLVAQVPTLSMAVEEVVLKALSKDPRDRFVTVADFTLALEQAVRAAPIDNSFPVSLNVRPSPTSGPRAPAASPLVDWDDAPVIPIFYGREEEQTQLTQWIVQERCRVVSILGMGGIGKSALSVSIMHRLAQHFDVVIFRSLRDAPSCDMLLDDCLQVFSPQPLGQANLEHALSLLQEHLRKTRVLVVLDNLECLLQERDVGGHFRPGFEEYGQLLHRVSETGHQSCLLFTSREKPADLRPLEGRYSQVHSLRLAGLDVAACKQILEAKEVLGTSLQQERLIQAYGGNPLALKIVSETILDLFGGDIGLFLSESPLVFGNITDLLEEQFARLSPLEQHLHYCLAIAREPMTLNELLAVMVSPLPRVQVLEAIDGLRRRSLIEPGKRTGSFTLQSVVLEYVTTLLIAEGSREIQERQLNRLIQHGLSQAGAKEYVRQAQERLLLSPLLVDLQSTYWEEEEVEAQLLSLLDELRKLDDSTQGYGPANLIALLRLMRGNLNGLDLSMLSIRGAYLQGITMQEAKLSGALIHDTVFTEAVSATWSIAISQDGTLWAAGGMQGEVRVWGDGGRTLLLIWPAHTDIVTALAFSPDGHTLATGSVDRTVKLWDVGVIPSSPRRAGTSVPLTQDSYSSPYKHRGTLLWMDWQNAPQTLTFSPEGSLLACSGLGGTVHVWDSLSGIPLQNLVHPAHVSTVAWSPDGRLLASACFDGQLRLWQRQEARSLPTNDILTLLASWETSPVWSLAFAPDGSTLVSAGWDDRKVKLWAVETPQTRRDTLSEKERLLHTFEGETSEKARRDSGLSLSEKERLLHTFEGETSQISKVVWSPDGRTLACCSYAKAIWLWDVEQRRHRATLSGHTADINGMAFTPDSRRLLSGSADSTLRVWDVESGQCVRVMQGYAVSLYDLDWSPDGTHLVSGAMDGIVTIWDSSGQESPRELRGHRWTVHGVGWSPDGQRVASSGWDAIMHLWNPISGTSAQIFRNPSTTLTRMAWSPDGRFLAVGTFLQGMYVWDMTERRPCWVGEPNQTAFMSTAWSPDGRFLAGGSDNGYVYLWESADGILRERLLGHDGYVMSIAWSPNGRLLASGSVELLVWDVQARSGNSANLESPQPSLPVRTFTQRSSMIYALAWSPSGDHLISGGGDGMLRWWDVQSGKCVYMQEARHGTIRSLKVSPDGQFLASCGDDGAILIWNLASHKHVRTLRLDKLYERMDITGIRGLTEAQKEALQALGAIEEITDL